MTWRCAALPAVRNSLRKSTQLYSATRLVYNCTSVKSQNRVDKQRGFSQTMSAFRAAPPHNTGDLLFRLSPRHREVSRLSSAAEVTTIVRAAGDSVTAPVILMHYVMLCYVMLCYVMLCYVMLCYVMLRYVTLRYVTLRYVTLLYVTLRYVALRCIALHCIALHCIALHCIALHCITLHYITLHYIYI